MSEITKQELPFHPISEPTYFDEDGSVIAIRGDISREEAAELMMQAERQIAGLDTKIDPSELTLEKCYLGPVVGSEPEWTIAFTDPIPEGARVVDVWAYDSVG